MLFNSRSQSKISYSYGIAGIFADVSETLFKNQSASRQLILNLWGWYLHFTNLSKARLGSGT